jgi:hypothetical protein
MVKRGMLLSETKDGSALLEVDGRHYLLPMEASWQSSVAPRVGMFLDVSFNADGAPERLEPASTTQFEMPSTCNYPQGVESAHSSENDLSNNERKNR